MIILGLINLIPEFYCRYHFAQETVHQSGWYQTFSAAQSSIKQVYLSRNQAKPENPNCESGGPLIPYHKWYFVYIMSKLADLFALL